MSRLLLIILLFCTACEQPTRQERIQHAITGQWLVLWADHQLKDKDQYELYGRIQDSVIEAKGLKLISFSNDGKFSQVDSPDTEGKWGVSPAGDIYIGEGGRGFNDFRGSFTNYKDNVLQVEELLHVEKETIKLVWHFKKLKKEVFLLAPERNAWRKKPARPESTQEIRNRLSVMFSYYSDYFSLVARESSYFISRRVMIPLKFYQHAMGTIAYDTGSDFANLFFNREQSEEAYGYVKSTVYKLGNRYPKGKNYVEEYAAYMKLVAEEIAR